MLFFVDESYTPAGHFNPKTTFAGVMLREEVVRQVEYDLFSLKTRFFKAAEPWERELKGRLLLSRRDIESPRNRELVSELVSLCRLHDMVPFAVVQDGTARLASEAERLPDLYRGILWRADTFLKERYRDRLAVVVFDRIDRQTARKTAISFNNFMFRHPWGRSYTNLVVTPFFADSEVTPGLQLADVIAYCVNQRYAGRREGTDPYLEQCFRSFRDLTFNYQDPEDERRTFWGFAAIPARGEEPGGPG